MERYFKLMLGIRLPEIDQEAYLATYTFSSFWW
jgi:hypothetical protein